MRLPLLFALMIFCADRAFAQSAPASARAWLAGLN
jgi:hypothetical protein